MSVARIAIDDEIVDFARFLHESGPWESFDELQQAIATYRPSQRLLAHEGVAPYVLTPSQMMALKETFQSPTPQGYSDEPGLRTETFHNVQYILALQYGVPFTLSDQRNGSLIHDVFPMNKNINRPHSSLGARRDFGFHTDQAYNDNRSLVPTHVSLACIRNEEQAVLLVTRIDRVIDFLSTEARDQLMESQFNFHRGRPKEQLGVTRGKILETSNGHLAVRVGTDTTCSTPDAQKAFDELINLFTKHAEQIVLNAGEVCVFDNRGFAHSRSAFEPHSEPAQRRWIQRLHIAER